MYMAVVLTDTLHNQNESLHAQCRQLPCTKQQVSNNVGSNCNEYCWLAAANNSIGWWVMRPSKTKNLKQGMTNDQ